MEGKKEQMEGKKEQMEEQKDEGVEGCQEREKGSEKWKEVSSRVDLSSLLLLLPCPMRPDDKPPSSGDDEHAIEELFTPDDEHSIEEPSFSLCPSTPPIERLSSSLHSSTPPMERLSSSLHSSTPPMMERLPSSLHPSTPSIEILTSSIHLSTPCIEKLSSSLHPSTPPLRLLDSFEPLKETDQSTSYHPPLSPRQEVFLRKKFLNCVQNCSNRLVDIGVVELDQISHNIYAMLKPYADPPKKYTSKVNSVVFKYFVIPHLVAYGGVLTHKEGSVLYYIDFTDSESFASVFQSLQELEVLNLMEKSWDDGTKKFIVVSVKYPTQF